MAVIQLGPSNFRKKMFKELQSKKYHKDVSIICEDGIVQANRIMLAAQSKFLKKVMLGQFGTEMAEVHLPEIRVKYVERVIKFMYSGKLTVTNEELYKNYLVWHVKEIIQNIFHLDANIDLGALNLSPPPDDWEDPDPGPSGSGSGDGGIGPGSSSGNNGSRKTSNQPQPNGDGSGKELCHDQGGFRQNTAFGPTDETVAEHCEEDVLYDSNTAEQVDRASPTSDIIELEVPREEPDIIDLLDSDDDEDQTVAGSLTEETEATTVVMDNAEDDTERPWGTSEHEDSDAENNTNDLGNGIKKIVIPKASRGLESRKKRKTKRKISKVTDTELLPNLRIKEEKDITETVVTAAANVGQRPQIEPGKVVFRGKVVSKNKIVRKPKPSSLIEGVRKYNPNSFTITGLKKVESLIAVKEEKSIHPCQYCNARFEVFKSLVVHIQRNHTEKKAECPECGKKLSHAGAIKKHLLTHRPESEWPFECPLCHKKFQARADIPKHLMTSVHKNDNIPKTGTAEWFNLLYPERKGRCDDLIVKTEKQKEKEKEKLSNLPAELGVTMEEYEQFSPAFQQAATRVGTSKRRAETDQTVTMSVKYAAVEGTGEGRRTQRTAAQNAREILHNIQEDGAL